MLADCHLVVLAAVMLLPVAAPAQEIDIQPHRAFYTLTIETRAQRSDVTDVRGKLGFEWGETCDGWLVNQRFDAAFFHPAGPVQLISWNHATWEAKDGSQYRFTLRKRRDGVLEEELRGTATLTARNGIGAALFSLPEELEVALLPGTVFPTNYSILLLRAALDGETSVLKTVFDGSDVEPGIEVNAVVGRPVDEADDDSTETPDFELITGRAWPLRLAFFPLKSRDSGPEQEQSLWIQEDGIVRALILDYGSFTVRGTLSALEVLPAPEC